MLDTAYAQTYKMSTTCGKGFESRLLIKAEIQERAIKYFNEFTEVQVACTQKDLQHFYLADYKMLREEAPHAQITRTSPATSIKAKIYFNSPALVDIKDEIFVAMWNKLSKVRG